jgi:hypothetical protein
MRNDAPATPIFGLRDDQLRTISQRAVEKKLPVEW